MAKAKIERYEIERVPVGEREAIYTVVDRERRIGQPGRVLIACSYRREAVVARDAANAGVAR